VTAAAAADGTRVGAPDAPAEATEATPPSRRETRLFVAATLVAVLPVVVAAARAVLDHWQPISDNGVTVVRTLDVFSSHFPFLGYGSSVSNVLPRIVNHPGPLQFILLSPFAELFGPNAGLALGTATMNAAAIVIVGWAARRRAGTTGGLLALLVGGLLAWSMGSALLVDPWGPHSLILPLFAGCVLAWCVADGDLVLLPLAVGCASFASQTHLSVVYLGPGLLLVAAVWGWIRVGRAGSKWVGIAVLVAFVLWLPPIIEQFTTPVGNMTRLLDEAQNPPGGLIGVRNAARVTAKVVGTPPFWFRDSMTTSLRPPGGSPSSTAKSVDALHVSSFPVAIAEIGIVVALLGVVALLARRRRDRHVVTLAILAAVALAFGWYTIAQITTLVVGVSSHTFRILWSVGAFVTFALLLGAVRALRADSVRWVVPFAAAGILVVSVANLPAAASSGGAQVDAWAMPVVRDIDRQLGALRPEAPILANWPGIGFADPYSFSFTAELRRRGIPFVVSDRYLVRQFGDDRKYDGHNARSKVFYKLGQPARQTRLGLFRRVAFHDGLEALDRARDRDLSEQAMTFLLSGDVRPKPGLAGAQNLGLYTDLAFPFTDPAAARRAIASRDLVGAWRAHLLRASARRGAVLDELARMQEHIDRATVGVFVGPVDAAVPGLPSP
jgi:hypothetical protein